MALTSTTTYLDTNLVSYGAGVGHPTINNTSRTKLISNRNSVRNPFFKQLISSRGNATTPFYADTQFAKLTPGYTQFVFKDDGLRRTATKGITPGPYTVSVATLTGGDFIAMEREAVAQAVTSFNRSVAEFRTPFAGQAFSGELKETLELIRHPFRETINLTEQFVKAITGGKWKAKDINNFKRAWGSHRYNKAAFEDLPSAMSDLWLQYSFAVAPTVHDIGELLVLASTQGLKQQHDEVKGFGKSERSYSSSTVTDSGIGLPGLRVVTIESSVMNIIRGGLTAEFLTDIRNGDNAYLNSLNDIYTLPGTAWELIPGSWLVDYFANIGGILNSLIQYESDLSWVSNSIVKRYEVTTVYTPSTVTDRPDIISNISATVPTTVSYGVRSVNRTGTLFGIPPLVFSLPMRESQYANILAVLTSFFKT